MESLPELPDTIWKMVGDFATETGKEIFQGALAAIGIDRVRRLFHQREELPLEMLPHLQGDANANWLAGELEETQRKADNLGAELSKLADQIRKNPDCRISPQTFGVETDTDWFTQWRLNAVNVFDDHMQEW